MIPLEQGLEPSAPVYADVLVGIDGTRTAYEAVRQAAELAGPGGSLALLAVTAVRGGGQQRTAAIAPVRARRALGHAARLAAAAGITAATEIDERGPVADILLERARGHGLLVVGAPSMSRIAHVLVGGTATAAAHALPVSLLVCRRPPPRVGFADRVLVATDALERSDELVEFAIRLAKERGASLMLVHAIHGETASQTERLSAQVAQVTQALGEAASVRIEPGRPHEVIVRAAAAEGASLLILSSRRLGGLRSLGSVSERIVHDAPCSVLVVRPEDLVVASAS